ncbi:MAG: AI-2E family transporter [Geminicoccaceae bacterium]
MAQVVTTRDRDRASPAGPSAAPLRPELRQPLHLPGSQPPVSLGTMMITVAAVIAALYFGRDVFIPLALAVLLGFALSPIVTLLRQARLPRAPAVLIVVAIALALAAGFAWLLFNQAAGLAQDLPKYEYNLRQKVRLIRADTAGSGVLEQTADVLRHVQEEIQQPQPGGAQPAAKPAPPPSEAAAKPVQPIAVELVDRPKTPLETIAETLGVVAAPLATIGIMILFLIFVLIQREDLRDRFIRLFGAGDIHRTTGAMSDATQRIGRFLLMQLVINASFGALFGLGLWVIGVPSPLLWGLIGVVLRFVPYIGAPIAALLPLAISLAVDPGWTMPLEVLGLFLAVEAVCAYVMEPLLYGHSTGLSPAAIIVAAAFWTSLWGPVGLLLSTPLTACLVVMGRHVPQLEFLEILFGNEQPLPPAVRFYQRLLAKDQREAEELTRQHAEEHGMMRAFDEVVLPALGLVEADRLRGALDRLRLRGIAEEVDELVEDVADEHAPPRDGPAAILCCGARGALDDAAGALLAAVLREQGYDAALAATGAGGTAFEALTREGTRLAFVSRMDGPGIAQVRRAVQRVRGRLGSEVPVLVALWNADPEKSEPEALARSLGAERVALTLAEAAAAARELLGPPPEPAPSAVPEAAVPVAAS